MSHNVAFGVVVLGDYIVAAWVWRQVVVTKCVYPLGEEEMNA